MNNDIPKIKALYYKYYADYPQLKRIVLIHSEQVAKKAIDIMRKKNLPLEESDVYNAAILHDIGVVKCHAPSIFGYGSKPYLQHGIEGKKILEENGMDLYARICSTHTGTGISAEDIRKNHLPLPEADYLPESILEKLICYADKFFSKSHDLTKEKNIDEVKKEISRFGEDSLKRFMDLHAIFAYENQ